MPATSIVIVTANAVNRSGIETLLTRAQAGLEISAAFPDLSPVEPFLRTRRVDILIIDDTLPRAVNVGRAIRGLLTHHPGLGVLLLASRPTHSLIRHVLDCGARGFLHKDDAMEVTLVEAVQGIRKGGLYLSRRANQLVQARRALPDPITPRDVDVLQLLAEGYEVREIAAQIGVSEKTVYRILDGLRTAFGAQNNANLIALAHRAGLLLDPDPAAPDRPHHAP